MMSPSKSDIKDLPHFNDYERNPHLFLGQIEMKSNRYDEELRNIEAKFNILAQLCSIFRNDIQNMRK